MPYLIQIDANRFYTNYGPLVRAFEARLAEARGVGPKSVVTSCNGTVALMQTLLAVVDRVTERAAYCITPSWTFVATPAAIQAAGLVPYFADVSSGWALDPHQVEGLAARLRSQGHQIAAVMPVAPFGAPLDLIAWEAFQDRTGIPVVIDAAAGFDHFSHAGADYPPSSRLPVVISLHATKVFGIGEGAFIVTADEDLADRIRSWGNFGFHESRDAKMSGINSKMSEMSAAYGLALLDIWEVVRKEWVALTVEFRRHADSLPFLVPALDQSGQWVSSYGLVRLADSSIDLSVLMRRMADQKVETRRWWALGCHMQPAYRDCGQEKMGETKRLAKTVLGLPFWRGLKPEDMTKVFSVLADAVRVTAAETLEDLH